MNSPRPLKYQSIKHKLFKRSERSHKGDNGHVLIIGGDHGFGGAVLMSAEAAARSGAGLISAATRSEHLSALLARRPEIMAHSLEHAGDLAILVKKASVIVIGPGLGQSAWSVECLNTALSAQTPMLVDADALNLISQDLVNASLNEQCIITPHPGEAARLLACSTEDIENDRQQACLDLQEKYGCTAILKGAGTLVAFQHNGRKQLDICVHGNPGMGTGGMGDVLSGLIGGLMAQGFSIADSARLGVCIHSYSADLAANDSGMRGLLASDLMPYIHKLVNEK